ncbi:TIGR01777 family oxidoreductase [Flavobacterium sp.]|jgi:uncharacterized protein (TIGR01777 family)|uniref:TIGR01777 family oxidoreductase n=1 Tax=Flavobacterium sp. TaxID=239 RepID=UPI0037BEE13E
MKILITGATGLVGKELIALLLENGNEIHYLTTSQSKIESKPHFQGFYWNTEQSFIDENCLMGVDAIIHLAGATVSKRWTTNYKEEIIESRTLSSNLLYTCLKNHPNQVKQIVSASAIGIYPDSLTQIYTEETKSVDDGFLGQVVVKWEESVDVFSRLNLKVCKLRIGLVLSNKGGALSEMIKPIKLGIGSPFGSGKQVQSWIHIHDLAAMFYFALQNQWEGTFNAVAPNPVTNTELTKAIAKTVGKPVFMPNIPKFAMKLLLGEMHQLLFSSQNVSAVKAEKNGFKFRYRDLTKTLDNLLT